MAEHNGVLHKELEDVGGIGELDLFDETGIGPENFCRFHDAAGDERPEHEARCKKRDILGDVLVEQVAEDLAHRCNEDQHADADPPWAKHRPAVALLDLEPTQMQPDPVLLAGKEDVLNCAAQNKCPFFKSSKWVSVQKTRIPFQPTLHRNFKTSCCSVQRLL